MAWRRVGECPPERCRGRCCEHIGVWYDDTPDNRAFIDSLRVRGVKVKEAGGKLLVDIDQRCHWLRPDKLCGLHPDVIPVGSHLPQRPSFCWDWPQEPSQLINDLNCGFSFIEEEEPVATRGGKYGINFDH